jgi:proline iminopeptidase
VKLFCAALLAATLAAQPKEGKIARDGLDLYYQVYGTGPSRVLMLSGGPGFNVDYMKPVAEGLGPQFTSILLEQRGTGRSRPARVTPENCNLALVTEDIEVWRNQAGIDRIAIVGHSWGGGLAMLYAAAHPEHIDRLVLVGSMGLNMEFARAFGDTVEMRLLPEDRAERERATARKGDPNAALDAILAIVPAYFYSRAAALEFKKASPRGSFWSDTSGSIMAGIGKYELHGKFAAFDRPVLLVQGHQDPMGTGTVYETAKEFRGARIQMLHKCGHFPWLEAPSEFFAAVRNFLEK